MLRFLESASAVHLNSDFVASGLRARRGAVSNSSCNAAHPSSQHSSIPAPAV
jgi:hypothetical protein